MPLNFLLGYQVSSVNIAVRGKYSALKCNLNKMFQWNCTFASSARIEVTICSL